MFRTTLVLAALSLTALAMPQAAAGPLDAIDVADPCSDFATLSLVADECDAVLYGPGPDCYSTTQYPPAGMVCHAYGATAYCTIGWTTTRHGPVPQTVTCVGQDDSGLGAGCAATTDSNDWRGAGCSLLGVSCTQAYWGLHTSDLVVGGYSGCNAVVMTRMI